MIIIYITILYFISSIHNNTLCITIYITIFYFISQYITILYFIPQYTLHHFIP